MKKSALENAQAYLENVQKGSPTPGEAAITWAVVALATNLGRLATALDKLADRGVSEK